MAGLVYSRGFNKEFRMKMQYLLAVALALLAGLVLGGLGPRADLQKLKKELEQVRREGAKTTRSSGIGNIATVLNLPKPEAGRAARPKKSPQPAPASTNAVVAAPATNQAARARENMKNHLEEAKNLWATRVELARKSFVSNTGLDTEKAATFDVLMESMNLRLGERIDKWAEQIRQQGDASPENALRMVNELSSAIVLTYDEMDRRLPSGWRAKAGDDFQLFNFIDPEVVTPLLDLDTVFQNKSPRHRSSNPIFQMHTEPPAQP